MRVFHNSQVSPIFAAGRSKLPTHLPSWALLTVQIAAAASAHVFYAHLADARPPSRQPVSSISDLRHFTLNPLSCVISLQSRSFLANPFPYPYTGPPSPSIHRHHPMRGKVYNGYLIPQIEHPICYRTWYSV